jgi:hypothetical protein
VSVVCGHMGPGAGTQLGVKSPHFCQPAPNQQKLPYVSSPLANKSYLNFCRPDNRSTEVKVTSISWLWLIEVKQFPPASPLADIS